MDKVGDGFRLLGMVMEVDESEDERTKLPVYWAQVAWMGGGVRMRLAVKHAVGEVLNIPVQVMALKGKSGFWVRERVS